MRLPQASRASLPPALAPVVSPQEGAGGRRAWESAPAWETAQAKRAQRNPISPRHHQRHSAQMGIARQAGRKLTRRRHLAQPVVRQHIRWCAARIRA